MESVAEPGISVIIPAFNYGHYLPEAIASALEQTYPNVEIIVIDDGSTDNTAEVASRFAPRGVRYVYQKNGGLSAARNTGVSHATHSVVSFLDADDKLLPTMCERMMRTLAELPPEFALVGCATARIQEDGAPLPTHYIDGRLSRELFTHHFILKNRFPCNVAAKKVAFESCGGFDTSLTSSEDRDKWIQIATQFRVFVLGEPLVLIRRHGASMSANSSRMQRNMRRVIAKAWSAAALPKWHPVWLQALAFNEFETAWMYADEGRLLKATSHLLASLALWPVFLSPWEVGNRPFFRIRSLAKFAVCLLTGKKRPA